MGRGPTCQMTLNLLIFTLTLVQWQCHWLGFAVIVVDMSVRERRISCIVSVFKVRLCHVLWLQLWKRSCNKAEVTGLVWPSSLCSEVTTRGTLLGKHKYMVFKVVNYQTPNLEEKLINLILLWHEELIQILQSLRWLVSCTIKSRSVI